MTYDITDDYVDEDDSDDNIGSLFNMDKKNNLNNSVAADLR